MVALSHVQAQHADRHLPSSELTRSRPRGSVAACNARQRKAQPPMLLHHRSRNRRPLAAGRRRLIAGVAAVTPAASLPLVGAAAPAYAQAGTPPYWSQSPFAVPSGVGASVPFTEYEAVNASTNGTVIGPDFTQGDLATEAVDRRAVQLTAQGQYVQFTLTSAANAFDVHYALSQGASGTLSVYVNGSKLSQELTLTSAYSYIQTSE